MKKGLHAVSAVLTLVILVLAILVSWGVFSVVHNIYKQTEQTARCASQIRAHAAVVRITTELKDPNIICPSERFNIDAKDTDPREFLAGEMKRCWDMWGNGNIQLFGKEEGIYCHVCSVTNVVGADFVEGVGEFMDKEKTKDGRTYSQYLTGTNSGSYYQNSPFPDVSKAKFTTSRPIGTIFYYVKGQEFIKRLENQLFHSPVVTVGGGLAAGLIVGGLAWSATGVGIPIGITMIVAGGVVGGGSGLYFAFMEREPLSYLSAVVVRPLSDQDIERLGCTYAPVSN